MSFSPSRVVLDSRRRFVPSRRSAPGRERQAPRDLGTVLVTGASTGIGAATAAALARQGFQVLAGVRTLSDADDLAASNHRIEPIQLDITDPAAIAAFGERIAEDPRGLSGLVNNAGILSVGPVELVDEDRWEAVIRTNVLGTIAVTRMALPALLRAHGRVINVSSPVGRLALPMFGPYSVSKFALESFNDTLRREVSQQGVRVVCVTPGPVSTPIFDKGIAEGRAMFDDAAPEFHARYGAMAASAILAGEDSKRNGATPDAVAEIILHALTTRRPKTRYRMGIENQMVAMASRLLPDRAVDALVARIISASGRSA